MPEVFASEPLSRSFWRGTQPLWKAFWLVYVAGHVVFGAVLQQCVMWVWNSKFADTQMSNDRVLELLTLYLTALFVVILLFFIACAVAVWRCSASNTLAVWRWGARAVLVLHGLLLLSQGVVLGYLLLYGWEAGAHMLMSL